MEKLLINNFIDFMLYERGENFTCNSNTCRALFQEAEFKIAYFDDKIMITKSLVPTGSLLNFQGYNWLVISQVDNDNAEDSRIYRSRIRKVEQCFKLKLNNNLYTFPAIFESVTSTISTDKNLILATGKMLVTVADNADAQNLALNLRFIKWGSSFKITGIVKPQMGLVILTCEVDQFQTGDDKVNEIAVQTTTTPSTPTNLISINGNAKLHLNATGTYSVVNFTSGEAFIFGVLDAITGNVATGVNIVSTTDTSVTLKAINTSNRQVLIKATDKTNNSISTSMVITVSSGL